MNKLHKEKLNYKETKSHYYEDEHVYKKYKKVKRYHYCLECGQTSGHYYDKVGIGLLGYKKKKYKKDFWYFNNKVLEQTIQPLIVESLLSSPSAFSYITKRIKVPKKQ